MIGAIGSAFLAPIAGTAQIAVPVDLSGGPEEEAADDDGVIDILVRQPGSAPTPAQVKECEDRQEAATVSREIVVCGQLLDDSSNYYSGNREAAQKRYAEATRNAGTLPTPDVAGPGIFRGPATVSGLCFIPPCPDPPALIIDVEALPEAPPGSDADRIARGLDPLHNNGINDAVSEEELGEQDTFPPASLSPEERERREAELGLPEPLAPQSRAADALTTEAPAPESPTTQ
ncbi:MAG: hypothetical protein ABJP48_05960 [Erythrobacter sp.]